MQAENEKDAKWCSESYEKVRSNRENRAKERTKEEFKFGFRTAI